MSNCGYIEEAVVLRFGVGPVAIASVHRLFRREGEGVGVGVGVGELGEEGRGGLRAVKVWRERKCACSLCLRYDPFIGYR